MTQLSNISKMVLEGLRQAAESDADQDGFRQVYLDNAAAIPGLSRRQYAGHLSALEAAGFYKPIDGYAWGNVKDHVEGE